MKSLNDVGDRRVIYSALQKGTVLRLPVTSRTSMSSVWRETMNLR